jgi:hypothetical protein
MSMPNRFKVVMIGEGNWSKKSWTIYRLVDGRKVFVALLSRTIVERSLKSDLEIPLEFCVLNVTPVFPQPHTAQRTLNMKVANPEKISLGDA